ncbi:MAG: DNA topoisomerase IV subunit A, partial [Kiritimatiellaeota bacterium]|nr:DNA topoisomerase IV subunit A [Kiritimatiellota bacterium]
MPAATGLKATGDGALKQMMDSNFLQYAAYVIRDRAIPDVDDGLKPVQRRILFSLHENDDGKFIKVANIVGYCMQFHPHGDASIADALVTLTNKGRLIEGQGNFGNVFTGDMAAAPR